MIRIEISGDALDDLNESWEAYGGARWIYFDDADIGALTLELDDDFLFELGARYNF
jgi:hypothetical protein